ncbi:MAG: NTP transferase domain-containing protein [Verrucomicrobiaceae bacterium]|nr:NTP transferase domain-containing protein [Verrucomicrobiaceae bacterium]
MSATPKSRYAVILAGGSGQRFWPVSRDALPKQLLKLFGENTLLELTLERLKGIVPRENTLILTNHQQEKTVRELAKQLPAENIIAEPAKRDTGPAIALGIGWVAARDPHATMMVLPSDHLIQDTAAFQTVLRASCEAAEKHEALVTIGIKPTWPCPSYGYVERAALAGQPEGVPVYEVSRFREKPDSKLAEHFLAQGNFTWNAGMFIWSLPTVLEQLKLHAPELATFVGQLSESADLKETVATHFPHLPKLSIDYALMEKAARVLNAEATFDWDDVGNWTSVAKYLSQDADGNQHNCTLSQHGAKDNIIFSQTPQHIALLGVENLLVVAAGDAILVASKDQAEAIKKLADQLPGELK